MNATEAATLCRAAKSVCPQQKFDEFTPDFWHPLLEDISFEDAKRGLIEVAKRQPFVSPAEIRTEVATTRRRLVAAIPAVVPPWQLADLPADEQRWVANYRHAIADGLPGATARTKANYLAGITDEEPRAIEAGEQPSLRDVLDLAERERADSVRLAQIAKEVARREATAKRDEQRAAIDAANVEAQKKVTAEKEAKAVKEVASVDGLLARHATNDDERKTA